MNFEQRCLSRNDVCAKTSDYHNMWRLDMTNTSGMFQLKFSTHSHSWCWPKFQRRSDTGHGRHCTGLWNHRISRKNGRTGMLGHPSIHSWLLWFLCSFFFKVSCLPFRTSQHSFLVVMVFMFIFFQSFMFTFDVLFLVVFFFCDNLALDFRSDCLVWMRGIMVEVVVF
jgi:hypothetical protein